MKKRNVILIILCIVIAIVLAVAFIGNANKNPLVGFWQEVDVYSDDIHILEFNENDYLTEITLSDIGDKDTNSYTYSFSNRSQNVVVMDNQSNYTYRCTVNNDTLSLCDDDGFVSTWERINSIDFLEKEQEERKEAERIRQEEEQRRREEEQRRREEEERKREEKMQNLREEFRAYCKNPLRNVEIKLVGKWIRDNTMYRDTHEFFENGTVISYDSDDKETTSGTYHIYCDDINPSEEELLQFENGNYEPKAYRIKIEYEDGHTYSRKLLFVDDYIIFRDSDYFYGWRFDRVS